MIKRRWSDAMGAMMTAVASFMFIVSSAAADDHSTTRSQTTGAADAGSSWFSGAVAALSHENCSAALAAAKQRLTTNPHDYEAERVAATAVDCENTLHARAYLRSRLHFGSYRPVDLDVWQQALAASTRDDPAPDYRALALCKLQMLSRRLDAALKDCERSYQIGRRGRFAYQAAFSLAQARLDRNDNPGAKSMFQEAADIAKRAGDERDYRSAVEHIRVPESRMGGRTPLQTEQEFEGVQQEMMRDMMIEEANRPRCPAFGAPC